MLEFLNTASAPAHARQSRVLGSLQMSTTPDARGGSRFAAPQIQVPMRSLDAHAPAWQIWQTQGPVRVAESVEVDGVSLQLAQDDAFLFATAHADPSEPVEAQSHRAYRVLLQRLRAHGKPHPLRIWNYIPHINAAEQGVERYRAFNSGRYRAFRELRYSVADGAPAACALGTHQGQLQIAILSGQRPPAAIENPRQISAYHYPEQYGVNPPLFSRAARYRQPNGADLLLISGTASIVGHASLHPGDVVEQTQESLRNIEALLSVAAGPGAAAWRLPDLSGRVYLRHAQDFAAVRACLVAKGMNRFSYVEADICRSDLLVEIEAEGLVGTGLAGGVRA
jgi:enamine deaminase RidA (YjgF/YER057c/UK114 family)